MITNTFKHEGLKELPNPPIIYAWFQLFQLEKSLNLNFGIKEEFYKKIDEGINLKYPAIGTFLTVEELGKTLRDEDLNKIPSMIEKTEISFAASRLLRKRNIPIEKESGLEFEDILDEINFEEITTSVLVISILIAINENKELKELIKTWKRTASSLVNKDDLIDVFSEFESLAEQSNSELQKILVDNDSDNRSRLFASLILLNDTNLRPEMLAYTSLYLYQYKTLTENIFREILSKTLSKVWLKRIETRFMFSNPNKNIPKIEAACTDSVRTPSSKIANILLAVLDSVHVPITDEFRKNLEMDAEND